MERMWRRVSGKQTKKFDVKNSVPKYDGNIEIASNKTTGKRLADSGTVSSKNILENSKMDSFPFVNYETTLSQYVVQKKPHGVNRSRRKRYKTRAYRGHGISCVTGTGDLSSSGGFYTLKDSNIEPKQPGNLFGTVLMYPPQEEVPTKEESTNQLNFHVKKHTDASIAQRAVSKLRMLNFNLNWDLHMNHCKPCGPSGKGNIITRRLCRNRNREENELYRSNSFKFERFDRKEALEVISSLQKNISLCDDYSLPLDFIKNKTLSSNSGVTDNIDTENFGNFLQIESVADLSTFGNVDVVKQSLETDCTVKAEQADERLGKYNAKQEIPSLNENVASSPVLKRRRKRRKSKKIWSNSLKLLHQDQKQEVFKSPYSDSSMPQSSEEENNTFRVSDVDSIGTSKELKSDTIENIKDSKGSQTPIHQQANNRAKKKSPYYYSDLIKNISDPDDCNLGKVLTNCKSIVPQTNLNTEVEVFSSCQRYSFNENDGHITRSETPTTTSDDSNCSECQQKKQQNKIIKLIRKSIGKLNNRDIQQIEVLNTPNIIEKQDLLGYAFSNKPTDFLVAETLTEMSVRKRKIYETAFDCKVVTSNDDLLQVDRVTNHSILFLNDTSASESLKCNNVELTDKEYIRSSSMSHNIPEKLSGLCTDAERNQFMKLTDDMLNLAIEDKKIQNVSKPFISFSSLKDSTSSSLPLHMNFITNEKGLNENIVQIIPPIDNEYLIDSTVSPVRKSEYFQKSLQGTCSFKEAEKPPENCNADGKKMNTPSTRLAHSTKFKGVRRERKFSSNESVITTSSEGSIESLRSSTSEGNCSTSSSESRRSSSLSSHSSETNYISHQKAPITCRSKRLILSPISDKSSLEPNLEFLEHKDNNGATSEDFKNLNSDLLTTDKLHQETVKRKKIPANKFIQKLLDELPCSDSGISIHSRDDCKSRNGNSNTESLKNFNLNDHETINMKKIQDSESRMSFLDTSKLALEIPQLKIRNQEQDNFTSGSATSVDLGDLPFDMPKLRRRMRINQLETSIKLSTESSGLSQASSSHSIENESKIINSDAPSFRRNLTLNFNEGKSTNKFCSLDLRGPSFTKITGGSNFVNLIDITIPLERQGWYHGAITRVDAETTLRTLSEGSFLVRNCESAKQDFSLSLKGAKGFMHMRIQRNEAGLFILGQFSRPFDTIPKMIRHFCLNRLPVRGAEHMCLLHPVISQVL